MRPQELCDYLVRDFQGARQFDALELLIPVRKALLKLDQAELVYPISHQRTPVWKITPLGAQVLAEGTLEQHLGPGK